MAKTYRVNEIFYSLQGEGRWAGHPALFLRLSGCNLRCPFCDTDFHDYREMTAGEIIRQLNTESRQCRFLVVTGGEPSLQLDDALVDALHAEGFFVTMETNGTHEPPENIDWVTLSPKNGFVDGAEVVIKYADEVKVIFDAEHDVADLANAKVECLYRYLQPCDVGNDRRNKEILDLCVEYIKQHPQWNLSLQQHKIINVR